MAVSDGAVWGPDLEHVEASVRAALGELGVKNVQAHDDTVAQVRDARQMGIHCDFHSSQCAARFGALAGVTELILVDVATAGGELHVGMTRIDVNVGGGVSSFCAAGASDVSLGPSLLLAVKRLYDPPAVLGRVRLTGVPEGATVLVDGTLRGTTPMPWPIEGLSPGSHEAVVTVAGFAPARIAFELKAAEARAIPVSLQAVPPATSPTVAPATAAATPAPAASVAERDAPAPWIATGVATAGAGVLVAVGAGIGAVLVEGSLAEPIRYADRETTRAVGLALLVTTMVGAAAAAGGALVGLGLLP